MVKIGDAIRGWIGWPHGACRCHGHRGYPRVAAAGCSSWLPDGCWTGERRSYDRMGGQATCRSPYRRGAYILSLGACHHGGRHRSIVVVLVASSPSPVICAGGGLLGLDFACRRRHCSGATPLACGDRCSGRDRRRMRDRVPRLRRVCSTGKQSSKPATAIS